MKDNRIRSRSVGKQTIIGIHYLTSIYEIKLNIYKYWKSESYLVQLIIWRPKLIEIKNKFVDIPFIDFRNRLFNKFVFNRLMIRMIVDCVRALSAPGVIIKGKTLMHRSYVSGSNAWPFLSPPTSSHSHPTNILLFHIRIFKCRYPVY